MPESSSLLAAAGSLLYGGQWQAPLARALDVNLRTMQRWAAGEYEPPQTLWSEIDGLLHVRQSSIGELRKKLKHLNLGGNQMWYSVETPSVFREYELPEREGDWSPEDLRKYRKLESLAERHGTHVTRTRYRRG